MLTQLFKLENDFEFEFYHQIVVNIKEKGSCINKNYSNNNFEFLHANLKIYKPYAIVIAPR